MERLGLGCAPLGGLYRDIGDAEAHSVVETALEQGIRLFDTAPAYGNGASERRLGEALSGAPDVVVSTKVGHVVTDDGDSRWDVSGEGIRRSVELSLRRLRLDRVGILLLHDPQSAPGDLGEVLETGLGTLAELRTEGVVDRIGIGTANLAAHHAALRSGLVDVAMVSGQAQLMGTGALPELLPALESAGVSVLNVAVLATGLLAQPWPPDDAKWEYSPAPAKHLELARRLARRCDESGVELPTAALRFAATQRAVAWVVAGASTPDHVRQLCRRFTADVPPGLLEELAGIVEEGSIT